MKQLFTIIVLMAFAMGSIAQEVHFDFSATNSTGYEIYYRIIDEENHWVEVTYPCQNNDNYWWGYDKPEGKLILSDIISHDGVDYILIAIGDHAFCGCTGLRGVLELPQTINSIGEGAFKDCLNLNGNLSIPSLVTLIGNDAFADCLGLSGELYLNDSLQQIGDRAFLHCSGLTGQITIPHKVTSIGSSAFEDCTGFNKMVNLPKGLQFIGEQAFKGDSNIKQFSIKCPEPPVTAENAMEGIPTWINIFVPYGTKNLYQNTTGWSCFGEKIVEKSIWNGDAIPWTRGNGTEDDPFLIESAENLAWLAQKVNERFDLQYDIYTWYSPGGAYIVDTVYHVEDVNAYQDSCFRLVIDIDLQRFYGQLWTPIGAIHTSEFNDYSTCFSGIFDGAGHTIANYNYVLAWNTLPEGNNVGVFGLISDAVIKNLSVYGAKINTHQKYSHCGGIVGCAYNSTILNCHCSNGIIDCGANSPNEHSSLGGIIGLAHACHIENCTNENRIIGGKLFYYYCYVGGIAGVFECSDGYHPEEGIFNCNNKGTINFYEYNVAGGIIGACRSDSTGIGTVRIEHCFSKSNLKGLSITDDVGYTTWPNHNKVGGLIGYVADIDTLQIINCYSNDSLLIHATNTSNHTGGIVGPIETSVTLYIKNCYHAGDIISYHKSGIISNNTDMSVIRNCYFDASCAPDEGFGVPLDNDYMKTEAFVNQLNNGSSVFRRDTEPFVNDGYPVFGTDGLIFVGAEWYYEIQNNDGSITFQHLKCVGDTLISREGKRPKVIVRSNTHYDRDGETEVTHEYVYEENGVVYWWNKTLEKFTVLYDFGAEIGDEWTIEVGDETITTHVYASDLLYIEGIPYKKLTIADPNNVFSGSLLSSIGHQTSFFPERLMTRDKGYRVDGMRCYWVDGELVYKTSNEDCDAIYAELHNGIEEPIHNAVFAVYPNPTTGILFVETVCTPSLPEETEYRIINPIGQTLLQGHITNETQQINIEKLPAGMYFITIAGETQKFVVR